MRVVSLPVLALGCVGLLPAALWSQSAQPSSGLIMGRVVEASTGAPVRGAIVQINTREHTQVMTDGDGQFVFGTVPAGRYGIRASRFGYQSAGFGQHRANGDRGDQIIVLAPGEHRADLTIRLWKQGAITGRVVDEFGEPAVGVDVDVFARVFVAGRPKLTRAFSADSRTDDRGVYRLSRLVAGDYVVAIIQRQSATPAAYLPEFEQASRTGDRDAMMAMFMDFEQAGVGVPRLGSTRHIRIGSSLYDLGTPPIAPREGRVFVYPTQYNGGASQASTTRPITVGPGQEVAGIDFALRPVSAVRISGQVTDQNGPAGRMPVSLTPVGSTDFRVDRDGPANSTITDPAGRFTLQGVTPGPYILRVLKGPAADGGFGIVEAVAPSDAGTVISRPREMIFEAPRAPLEPTLFATVPITVGDSDVNDVAVVVRNGVRLSGRVEFIGTHDSPSSEVIEKLEVEVERRDGGTTGSDLNTSAKVLANRTFETPELVPGGYFLRVPAPPPGWTLESVTANGRDVSDVSIDLIDKPVTSILVRFTDKPSTIAGTVRPGSRDDRLDEALILVFPQDRSRWVDYGRTPRSIRDSGVSRDGAFTFAGLPAGEYLVAAIRDDFISDWKDPAFLMKVAAFATRVTIGAGDQRTVSLNMGRVR